MRVFISWSGPQSQAVAAALKDFLPKLMNDAEPWMSKTDIAVGQRWAGEIADALEASSVGIICVTRANQHARWLNFEAGAIAKKVSGDTFVIPLAIDLKDTEVELPLAQFQATPADRDGLWELVASVNSALPKPRPINELEEVFDAFWPKLKTAIDAAQAPPEPVPAMRTERDLIEEVLQTVRGIAATTAPRPLPGPRLSRLVNQCIPADHRPIGTTIDWEEGKVTVTTNSAVPESVQTFTEKLLYAEFGTLHVDWISSNADT